MSTLRDDEIQTGPDDTLELEISADTDGDDADSDDSDQGDQSDSDTMDDADTVDPDVGPADSGE
jgi:hypothetical protein